MALSPLAIAWILGAGLLLLDGRRAWVCGLAALGLAAVLALDLLLLALGPAGHYETVSGGWLQGIGIRLRVDGLAVFFGAVCAAVLLAVLVHESRAEVRSRFFPALIVLLCTGLHGAFFTGDLFNYYVFFELAVVASFALAAYGYGRAEIRGTLIYIAINLLGTTMFLVGVAIVYHATGTLDLDQISREVGGDGPRVVLLGATLIFIALALKLGLFPFHGWVPVLYSHARPAVAAAMTGALVNIGAYGMVRMGYSAFAQERNAGAVLLVVLGAAACVYGSLLALRRVRPAEVLAYAAVAHAGYVVLALGVGGAHGVAAVLLVVLSGSIDKSSMFLSLDASPAWARRTAMVGAASAAGLPVTIGFVSKIQLVRASLEAPGRWVVLSAVLLASVLLVGAGLRLLACHRAGLTGRGESGAAIAMAGLVVALGLASAPVGLVVARISAEVVGGVP